MKKENIVGPVIARFRKLRGWSQEDLALEAEINTAYLGHLERGLKSPTVTTLKKITDALEITLAEFFYSIDGDPSLCFGDNKDENNAEETIIVNLYVPDAEKRKHIINAIHEILLI